MRTVNLGKSFLDFCSESTIHGLSRVADVNQSIVVRVVWLVTICVSFVIAGIIIYNSFKGQQPIWF